MRLNAHATAALSVLSLAVIASSIGCSSSAISQAPAAKPAPPPIEFLGAWGTKGTGPGLLGNPRSVATDTFGDVFIADAGTPTRFVHKFKRDGHPLLSFEPLAAIHNPCGAAVDSGGAIYILECGAGALYLFFPDGTLMHGIRGGLAAPAKPSSVAVDDAGRIYVGDARLKRILMYSPRGRLLGSLNANGQFKADQIATGPNGDIFVCDSSRNWIARISFDGAVQKEWTVLAQGEGENERCFLAVTKNSVVVLRQFNSAPVLHIFSYEGVEKLAGAISGFDPFLANVTAVGIAATGDGEFFILDATAPRVLRFRLNAQ
jgi:DNA-binding beta-propeller fold protein YncE